MGIIEIFKKKSNKIPEEENVLYQPVNGTVIPQENIPDKTFSSGTLGKGCGIQPDDGTVYSPVYGKVIFVADTKHAIGIKCNNGLELLIHVGIGTVEMGGNGFELFVKEGDNVQTGKHILTFNPEKIRKAGYNDTVVMLITNTEELKTIEFIQGTGLAKEKIMKAVF